jgi:predicted DNA-binding transcriptional regulator AlpA
MPTAAYSIAEFCRAHGVSKAFFYVLLKRGDAPDIMSVGKRRLVAHEAAEAWRRRMESSAANQPTRGGRRS